MDALAEIPVGIEMCHESSKAKTEDLAFEVERLHGWSVPNSLG